MVRASLPSRPNPAIRPIILASAHLRSSPSLIHRSHCHLSWCAAIHRAREVESKHQATTFNSPTEMVPPRLLFSSYSFVTSEVISHYRRSLLSPRPVASYRPTLYKDVVTLTSLPHTCPRHHFSSLMLQTSTCRASPPHQDLDPKHGSASLGQQSIKCGHDILWATPQFRLLLGLSSGSGSTMNAPFGHLLHDTIWHKVLVHRLAFLPQMSTSKLWPRSPGRCGRHDQS
jgi:hypothetical protein